MSSHIMMCNVPNAGACFVPSCACGCHKSTEPKRSDPVIPSLGEVRADYIRDHTRNFDSYLVGRSLASEQEFYGEKFDRWLSEHDRQVAERAWDSGFSAGQAWEGDVNSRVIPQMTRWDNPYRAAKGEQK